MADKAEGRIRQALGERAAGQQAHGEERHAVVLVVLEDAGDVRVVQILEGRGVDLPDDLVPPLAAPVTVQLVNDTTAACYEAVFDSGDVIRNAAGQFKAKSQ